MSLVPVIALVPKVEVRVGAVVSAGSFLLSLSLAQETKSRVGTRLTARVLMHQANMDFGFFLLMGKPVCA